MVRSCRANKKLYVSANGPRHGVTKGTDGFTGALKCWHLLSWAHRFPPREFLQSPPGIISVQVGVRDHESVVAPISSLMALKFASPPFYPNTKRCNVI